MPLKNPFDFSNKRSSIDLASFLLVLSPLNRMTEDMKILIVDDNTDFTALLKLMLENEGFDVSLANNGEDGYSAYLLFEPDVVITDIQMPIKTGIELVGLIRGHNPRVRTVYMSADLTPFLSFLKEEQEKYGVSVLQKPFSKTELMKSIS